MIVFGIIISFFVCYVFVFLLCVDISDFYFCELLMVICLFMRVFMMMEFNDFYFIVMIVCNNFSSYFIISNDWCVDFYVVIVVYY